MKMVLSLLLLHSLLRINEEDFIIIGSLGLGGTENNFNEIV